jgi:tenascin
MCNSDDRLCNSDAVGSEPGVKLNFLNPCSEYQTGGLAALFLGSTACEPLCPYGWGGDDCAIELCNPIAEEFSNEQIANLMDNCNGRGLCSPLQDPPVCVCDTGWRGDGCVVADCPGDPDCSNVGTCTETPVGGVCVCDTGFKGDDCSTLNCTDDCKARGECIFDGMSNVCHCTVEGWAGDTCDKRVCPFANGQECNGHGLCGQYTDGVRGGRCECVDSWGGLDCTQFSCEGTPECNTPHGLCILRGGEPECDCGLGYTGSGCIQLVDSGGSSGSSDTGSSSDSGSVNNGGEACPVNTLTGFRCSGLRCDEAAHQCQCAPFYKGDACEEAVCDADFLADGASVFKILMDLDYDQFDQEKWRAAAASFMGVAEWRVCILHSWRGSVGMEVGVSPSAVGADDAQPATEQLFTGVSASAMGSTDGTNNALLTNVTNIERVVVGPTANSCVRDCSLHGVCTTGAVCQCDLGWVGDDCSVVECPGTPSCFNRGNCSEAFFPPRCLCDAQWSGEDCASGVCPDDCNYPQGVCDGMGEEPVCVCEPGYEGDYCEKDNTRYSYGWNTLDWVALGLVCGALAICVFAVLLFFSASPFRHLLIGKESTRVDKLRTTRKSMSLDPIATTSSTSSQASASSKATLL